MPILLFCLLLFPLCLGPGVAQAAGKGLTFGLLMVGPMNDHGWSQAHYEAGKELEAAIPGVAMLSIDRVNPVDRPGITVPMLVDDLVSKGAQLVIANSHDMRDGIREAAEMHPEVKFVHISGDDVRTGKAPANLTNLMGRVEYAKMMAGFVAAMTTETGKIGYLGPLINAETRRLAVAAFLGARYAWTEVRGKPAADLGFKVSWIGFWFNIPGVTADPTLVARNFIDSGFDVIVSGLDTTEALVVADQRRRQGKKVWAFAYDYVDGCAAAPDACLGVPYFNWLPGFRAVLDQMADGKWQQEWAWLGPDWSDVNNHAFSSVGFKPGKAMAPAVQPALDAFVKGLGHGTIQLFKGPLKFQDGSLYLTEGELADDDKIWYLPQLLEGMEGASK